MHFVRITAVVLSSSPGKDDIIDEKNEEKLTWNRTEMRDREIHKKETLFEV